jgi:hypothetical protein
MLFIIFSLFVGLALGYMAFVDYSNGKFKTAAFSGVLSLVQFVIVGVELLG